MGVRSTFQLPFNQMFVLQIKQKKKMANADPSFVKNKDSSQMVVSSD